MSHVRRRGAWFASPGARFGAAIVASAVTFTLWATSGRADTNSATPVFSGSATAGGVQVTMNIPGALVFAGEPAEIADTDIFAHYFGAEMAEFSSHA